MRGRHEVRFIGILILILAMMIGNSMPVMASSATGLSGKCGDDVSYSYASGILTISGQGAMYDYTANTIPWYSKKDKIKTIRIESGVTVLGSYAFSRCRYADRVSIPASVIQIRTKAFSYCDSLETVDYAGSAAKWEDINFMSGNSELKTALSTGVATINTYREAAGTVAYRITNGVLYVSGKGRMPAYRFMEAPWFGKRDSIKKIVVGSGITAISTYAFACCNKAESVEIPDSVTEIAARAFYKDFALKSISLPAGLTEIGRMAFQDCTSLSELVLPSGIKEIPEYMCCGCTGLKSLVLPASVTSIGASAFYNSQLAQITYAGAQEKWSQITLGVTNKKILSAAKILFAAAPAKKAEPVKVPATVITKTANVKGYKLKVVYQTVSDCDGYQVQAAKTKEFTNPISKTVDDKNDPDKVVAGCSKGKWYARVRAFRIVDGKKVYSDWSPAKGLKLTK